MNDPVFIKEIFSSIQGEGYLAGRRQIFVRLVDCNLECSYCDTDHSRQETCLVESRPGSATFEGISQPVAIQTLAGIIAGWCSSLPGAHHSISITGGEPLLHAVELAEWLPGLRGILPVHLETNGTMHVALGQVIQHLDYISMDMKLPSTSGCTGHLWELHRAFLQASLGRTVSVKVVIGDATTLDEIRQVCAIIREVDRSTPLFLQPLTRDNGTAGIQMSRILPLQEAACALLPDVRVIPQMHRMLGAL